MTAANAVPGGVAVDASLAVAGALAAAVATGVSAIIGTGVAIASDTGGEMYIATQTDEQDEIDGG